MMIVDPMWQAVFLGILQGLGEFLPISSSAHLILLPWLLGWKPMGLDFDVALHAGTLIAVLLYFRKDLVRLSLALLRWLRDRIRRVPSLDVADDVDARLSLAILVGTIPAVIVGGLFGDLIEEHMRSPLVTVFTLSFFALFLWFADAKGTHEFGIERIGWKGGLLIGAAQVVALVPGVSRSGITITAALLLGLMRSDAARFSFLLATPVVVLAAMKAGFDLWRQPALDGSSGGAFLLGIIVSAITGFLCIKYFLRFLQASTYVPFVVYRLLLACFILALLFR